MILEGENPATTSPATISYNNLAADAIISYNNLAVRQQISYNNLAAAQQHTFKVRAVDTTYLKEMSTPTSFNWTILTPPPPQSTANQQAGLNVHTNTQQNQESKNYW